MKFSDYVNESLADNQRYHAGKLVQILPADKDGKNDKIVKVTDGKKSYDVNIDDLSLRAGIVVSESDDMAISTLKNAYNYLTKNEHKLKEKKDIDMLNKVKNLMTIYKKTKQLPAAEINFINKEVAPLFD